MTRRGQFANPIGTAKHSGTVVLATAPNQDNLGKRRNILSISREPQLTLREEKGLAMLHFQTEIVEGQSVAGTIGGDNSRVIADVRWSTGLAGGQMLVDITTGAQISLGAADHVSAAVYQDYINPTVTYRNVGPWRVDATVHWNGTHNPKPAYMTTYEYSGLLPYTSAEIMIPAMAREGMIVSPTPDLLPSTIVDVYTIGPTPRLLYSVIDPFANGFPIVQGARKIVVRNPTTGEGSFAWHGVFELWA